MVISGSCGKAAMCLIHCRPSAVDGGLAHMAFELRENLRYNGLSNQTDLAMRHPSGQHERMDGQESRGQEQLPGVC